MFYLVPYIVGRGRGLISVILLCGGIHMALYMYVCIGLYTHNCVGSHRAGVCK